MGVNKLTDTLMKTMALKANINNKISNLNMHIINMIHHGKRVCMVITHSLVCIRNLTCWLRSLVQLLKLRQLLRKYHTDKLSMRYLYIFKSL